MSDYLDAECVFVNLFSNSIFTFKVWKNTVGEKLSYQVSFELADSARRAGFLVYIKEARHCIGKTALLNISKQFNFPLGEILTK